jgi:hypothetical protein
MVFIGTPIHLFVQANIRERVYARKKLGDTEIDPKTLAGCWYIGISGPFSEVLNMDLLKWYRCHSICTGKPNRL